MDSIMPAPNKRFCEIGGWSDNPNFDGDENRWWKSKLRVVASPTSQSRRAVACYVGRCVYLENGILIW